jgi:hypothetical protein
MIFSGGEKSKIIHGGVPGGVWLHLPRIIYGMALIVQVRNREVGSLFPATMSESIGFACPLKILENRGKMF